MFKALSIITVIALGMVVADAGMRTSGKYNGVVLFDRWDGCYLHSAVYLMYVPEKLKDSLRPHAGKSVVLDVTEVFQPLNPGDGRLERFTFMGSSQPPDLRNNIDQIELIASLVFNDQKHPALKLVVRNNGPKPISLEADELAFTVLTKTPAGANEVLRAMNPSDGPSYALVTRHPLLCGGIPGWRGEVAFDTQYAKWSLRDQSPTVGTFSLPGDATKEFIVDFTLTEGEYDLLFGYGGGVHQSKSVVSNMIAVDVNAEGSVTTPKVKGR